MIATRCLVRLRTAQPGSRHYELRAAAVTFGGLLEALALPERRLTELLVEAVRSAGGAAVDEANARRTIAWGLQRGAQSPLQVGGR